MKYIVLIILILGMAPITIEAANPEFKQQIRAIVECNDGVDNDGDGLLDFASDPDCTSWEDISESPDLIPSPQPSPEPTPVPAPIPNPRPEPQPQPQPVPQPEPNPEIEIPIPIDYISSESIEYQLDITTPESLPAKQVDTYEDRTRLDTIFSFIMIGVLSIGLWIWDVFLNSIPK